MALIEQARILWEPPAEVREQANLTRYLRWLESARGMTFDGYDALWKWSVTDLEAFWRSVWEFFDVQASAPPSCVLASRKMPGARWFPGARLNWAQHVFRHMTDERPAILFESERHALTAISWQDLYRQVAAVAHGLRQMGVGPGDRVVAYMPNIPETAIAFLACASLGAVWSSVSPEVGTRSVLDRFSQISPKVLFAVDGYQYGGKPFDRQPVVAELMQALPGLERTVVVPYLTGDAARVRLEGVVFWEELLAAGQGAPLTFAQVEFDHPLWVLYSSGTTGLPKPIVHGHGGVLLEQLKGQGLHWDLKPTDRFFWFTTTSWVMWNLLISGLLLGSTIILYDGNPGYPDMDRLWSLAERSGMTIFGTSAAYLTACMKAGLTPGRSHDLSRIRCVKSTGSPLPPEAFDWVYREVKGDVWLASVSGGTDVAGALAGGAPILPVVRGELQCRCLGVKLEAWDESGRPLTDDVGELVVTEPMPSMPLYFWNDPDHQRYRSSYFDVYPGVWRHGDWVRITPRGGVVILGRSDSTLNRLGVRIGTSEIYSAVEELEEVVDSLVVGVEQPDGGYWMPMFLVLREGLTLDDALKERIRAHIRRTLSARHVPDEFLQVPAVPRTLNGKKLEVPIKKILMGIPLEKAVNPDSMSNPESLNFFVELANQRLGTRAG